MTSITRSYGEHIRQIWLVELIADSCQAIRQSIIWKSRWELRGLKILFESRLQQRRSYKNARRSSLLARRNGIQSNGINNALKRTNRYYTRLDRPRPICGEIMHAIVHALANYSLVLRNIRPWDYGILYVCETGNQYITGDTPDVYECINSQSYDWATYR